MEKRETTLHPLPFMASFFELIIKQPEKNIIFHVSNHISALFCANF